MSADTKTLSAAVEVDSELAEQFEEFREQNGMTSKSEAVRHLLRAGLAEQTDDSDEAEQTDDSDDDDDRDTLERQTPQTPSGRAADWIDGNEPIIFGFAFLVGAEGILSSMMSVAGAYGSVLFAVLGLGLAVWIVADSIENWRDSDESATPAAETETANGGVDA